MNAKSKWACVFSIKLLIKGGWAYLWTLTTPEAVDLPELSRRWRKLIWNGFPPCVRVFEKHPKGHGYHVHFISAQRMNVGDLRIKAQAVGFGRIHVRRIPGKKANYIAKYLTKQRGEPGVRLWSCVGFKGSQVKNIIIRDDHWEEVKMVMSEFPAPSGYNFYATSQLAERRLNSFWWDAITHGQEPGYKPEFPALFRHWVNSPQCVFAKPLSGWRRKSATPETNSPCETTLPLPLGD